ncbi:Methyltransferase domain-containing protein [Sporolactobacillus nakayamae]|uniref:site-specific DNA-methyltransferase (adenine-specific) n=2 Tax=Sporolactobacillus nakayamae TaxID=269670 RepID=A0A1I2QVG3_9BACL|nr:Methyltransferase domain-containing protein [Sporolactobacillus nakayamae]
MMNEQIDKKAIKEFAIYAREKLIKGVTQKAFEFGITKNKIVKPEIFEGGFKINGVLYDKNQLKQRVHLINEIHIHGYSYVIDRIAYTWFNRFIALRFMEVNGYLPTGIRIFSSIESGKNEPDVLSNIELVAEELGLDLGQVYDFQDRNQNDRLFKYILIHQCNKLSEIMPNIFESIGNDSELLLPDNLLSENSVIRVMTENLKEENWEHQVEIIGWLYQFYNSEKKDEVFAELKKNIKIGKDDIPAATQLFTPKWIVQYMVENSLGRLWLESHPNEELKQRWSYYIDEVEQPLNVHRQLNSFINRNLNPESIKVFDPCMGSGHILVYAFDLLFQIYVSAGYSKRDIPQLILQNNIYGLEIDERAKQLAYFSLVMKARFYDRQLFRKHVDIHVYAVHESNSITDEDIDIFAENKLLKEQARKLVGTFADAELYGSILKVPDSIDLEMLNARIKEIQKKDSYDFFLEDFKLNKLALFKALVNQATLLAMNFEVVVTNPPYMGRKGMDDRLSKFVKSNYPDASADLFAVMMERCIQFARKNGFISMITQQSWMFLSSFEKLRLFLLKEEQIYSMAHLGARAFAEIGGEVVQSTMFVLRNQTIPNYNATYVRLVDIKDADGKSKQFRNNKLNFIRTQDGFSDIPGSPIAYWASDQVRKIFRESLPLSNLSQPKMGMRTGDNERFIRLWFEVNKQKIHFKNYEPFKNDYKWVPYNKGGEYRKWYGNHYFLVNWENNGAEIKENTRINYPQLGENLGWKISNENDYFKESISWSRISSSKFGVRYYNEGFIFDTAGCCIFDTSLIILGLLASKLTIFFLNMMNPTLAFQVGDLKKIPIINFKNESSIILHLVHQTILISKSDWDSFETSWDFKRHPFLEFRDGAVTLEESYSNWKKEADRRYITLKANEEELNRIFIDLYGLQDELTPEESDDEVTVRRADRERDVKSFLSYCVGIMFGRYSLDEEELIFAGGDFDNGRYKNYKPDKDNVIPITDDTYFEDDLVGRLISILKLTFSDNTLEQNLDFIAQSLNTKSSETSRQRIRRYFLKEFYKDHVQIYKKRPIYWLFDSGKQNGFKALIYLHRYEPGLVACVRTDYLHAMERKYEEEMSRLDLLVESDAQGRDRVKARKQKEKLQRQLSECRQYDQIMAHMANQQIKLDLDDGVKVNYAKFQSIVVPQGAGKNPLKADLLAKI